MIPDQWSCSLTVSSFYAFRDPGVVQDNQTGELATQMLLLLAAWPLWPISLPECYSVWLTYDTGIHCFMD